MQAAGLSRSQDVLTCIFFFLHLICTVAVFKCLQTLPTVYFKERQAGN